MSAETEHVPILGEIKPAIYTVLPPDGIISLTDFASLRYHLNKPVVELQNENAIILEEIHKVLREVKLTPSDIHAVQFAIKVHNRKYRKVTGKPYVLHPIDVLRRVALKTEDPLNRRLAAVHDVFEESPRDEEGNRIVTLEEIAKEFDEETATLVDVITPPEKADPLNKKYFSIRRIVNYPDPRVTFVKSADITSNMQSLIDDRKKIDPQTDLPLGNDVFRAFSMSQAIFVRTMIDVSCEAVRGYKRQTGEENPFTHEIFDIGSTLISDTITPELVDYYYMMLENLRNVVGPQVK